MAAFYVSLSKEDKDQVEFSIPELKSFLSCHAMPNKSFLGPSKPTFGRSPALTPCDNFCINDREIGSIYHSSTMPYFLAHSEGNRSVLNDFKSDNRMDESLIHVANVINTINSQFSPKSCSSPLNRSCNDD